MDDDRARELLRAYGERSAPSPAERERAWVALAAAASAPASASAPATGSFALKTLLGVGAVITIGVASWSWNRTSDVVAPAPIATPAPSAPAALEEEASSAEPIPAAPRVVVEAPVHRVVPVRAITPVAEAPGTTESAPGTLAEELALMDEARQALARNDAATALAALDRHATRFPTGTLGREGEVLRVTALCASGQDDEAIAAATAAGPRPAITRALSRCSPR